MPEMDTGSSAPTEGWLLHGESHSPGGLAPALGSSAIHPHISWNKHPPGLARGRDLLPLMKKHTERTKAPTHQEHVLPKRVQLPHEGR